MAILQTLNGQITIKADTLANQTNALKIDGSLTTQPISVSTLPLPANASTSGLQTTGNTTLSSIETKTPTLGQALIAGSTPVVLPISQITSLTPQTNALTDAQLRASALSISASALPLATNASTATLQGTGNTSLSNIDTKIPTGLTVTANRLQVELPAGGTGLTNTEIRATALPISAVALPLPSGASTETTLGALNTKIPTGLVVTTGRLQVELPAGGTGLTNSEIRATPLAISGTVTASTGLSQPLTDTQLRASAVPVIVSTITTLTSITNALPAGTNAIGSVSSVDTTSTGTITAITQFVALALNGKSGIAIQVTGTWVGTLQFEGTVDGTNWVIINGVVAGTSTPGSTTTTNGVIRVTPSGLAQVRIISTAWTSGTATISIRASDATGGTFLNQSLTAGNNLIGKVGIDQTTPGLTNAIAVATATPTAITILQNAVSATGNGTAFAVTGYGTALLQITGTFVATINFEASNDAGVTWDAISSTKIGTQTISTTTTTVGQYRITVAGFDLIRARVTWTSGTSISINGRATNAVNASKIVQLSTSNPLIVNVQPNFQFNGPAALSAINTDLLTGTVNGWYDMQNYRNLNMQIIGSSGITAGAIAFETTNDTTLSPAGVLLLVNETTAPVFGLITGTAVITANQTRTFTAQSNFRYVRARISTPFAGGTVQASVNLSAENSKDNITTLGTTTNQIGNIGTVNTVSNVTSAGIANSTQTPDIASSAITSTTIGASIIPTIGLSYTTSIVVTAVTGTSPTMQVNIEESLDAGVTWFVTYAFPLITATGTFNSPSIQMTGNRLRYNQTLGGTTPSFTRTISRVQSNAAIGNAILKSSNASLESTITTANTPQNALIANINRNYFEIVNNDATTNLLVKVGGTASVNSIKIIPNGVYASPARICPTTNISVFSTLAGHKFTLLEL